MGVLHVTNTNNLVHVSHKGDATEGHAPSNMGRREREPNNLPDELHREGMFGDESRGQGNKSKSEQKRLGAMEVIHPPPEPCCGSDF